MNNAEFQLRGIGDPRLAVHATSALPAWLWSTDGTRILWANPVGASLLGAANGAALTQRVFGPADPHRRQLARLAEKLSSTGAIRLERLRGFGAPLGLLATCGCARIDFPDGSQGILVAAAETAGRPMPLVQRLQRLVEGMDTPIAAFARDGTFIAASDAARPLVGFRNLSEAGLDDARSAALKQGWVETPIGIAKMVLQRVGTGADVGLIALIEPDPRQAMHSRHVALALPVAAPAEALAQPIAPPADQPIADYEQPAVSGEAPAEFGLLGEFAESPTEPPAEPLESYPPSEPDPRTVLQPDMPPRVEVSSAEISAEKATPDPDVYPDEPSPFVEAVADEPTDLLDPQPPVAEGSAPPAIASTTAKPSSWLDEPGTRRYPLRFMWQMDAEGRFSLGYDEFTRLIGPRTAAGLGRPWSEIAEVFGPDPDGRVLKAVATRDTWSGISVNWPIDGGGRLPVELSALPIYDRMRNFAGYRGFGVCRDLDGLTRLVALRRYEFFSAPPPQTLSADTVQADLAKGPPAAELPAEPDVASPDLASPSTPEKPAPSTVETSQQTDLELAVETPKNVLPFRPIGEPKSPVLTAVENSAFNELARRLSARLEAEYGAAAAPPVTSEPTETAVDQPAAPETPEPVSEPPEWLALAEPPPRGETGRDKALLDLLPVGVLIYRLDRLLYANPAFLERLGYPSLHALEQAGGLDALYVEPGVSSVSSTSDGGTPVTISASQALSEHTPTSGIDARLRTISWDGNSALALIFSDTRPEPIAAAAPVAETIPASEPSGVGQANAEELGAILDTTAEGIVMFDADGHVHSCNRSAELQQARRLADRAANAKADMLARISHEIRMPLNAIIGFAEVMIGERFGALGNERYVEYMKDIRASGERVIAFINDLLDLSRIETGKLDLVFAHQNLNDVVESCVAVMQPQANRERIIIRTSLAHTLPPVLADARALRQIALNLIGNSIHLANAGGQVIVSTALSDFGEVVLRVRDTGNGLNDTEVAAAMEPFRTQAPPDQAFDSSGVSLSLTKALVEANGAQFHIKTGPHSGTLIEVVFSQAVAKA
jgi:signal transduction histidine kinase